MPNVDPPKGNGDRITVARVFDAVASLKELTAARFDAVEQRLELLSNIPERVASLEARVTGLENGSNYRRIHLPSLVIASLSLVVAIAAILL